MPRKRSRHSLEVFLWLIAAPLVLACRTALWAKPHGTGARFIDTMASKPKPLMALTLFLVIGAEVPRIQTRLDGILGVVPIYIAYVVAAPVIGRAIARVLALDFGAGRALIFSAGTRPIV